MTFKTEIKAENKQHAKYISALKEEIGGILVESPTPVPKKREAEETRNN